MDAIGISILASFCGIVLSVVLTYLANKSEKSELKKDTRLDTLWDVHNEKKHDSKKLEEHAEKISNIEKKHDYLDQKMDYHYKKIEVDIQELKVLVAHKNNGEGQGFNNIVTLLRQATEEIKKEIHESIKKNDETSR